MKLLSDATVKPLRLNLFLLRMIAGEEFKLLCGTSDTIGTLKQKISTKRRLSLSSVSLYCGPCLLTDNGLMVTTLSEFTESFLLELPEAGEIEMESEEDVFLVTGPRKKFHAAMRIKKTMAKKKIKIEADQEKFGVVTHKREVGSGTTVYTVERYRLKGKGKVTLRTSGEEVLVFLDGAEEPLVPVVMTYVERLGLMKTQDEERVELTKTMSDIEDFLSTSNPSTVLQKILEDELYRPFRGGNI